MNNDIKEILNNLKFNVYETKEWIKLLALNQETWKILLDYITNLEQEKQEMKNGWQQEVYNKDEILNRWYETQGRIDKAIRYIEKCRDYHKTYHSEERIFPDEIINLLMILTGGDE